MTPSDLAYRAELAAAVADELRITTTGAPDPDLLLLTLSRLAEVARDAVKLAERANARAARAQAYARSLDRRLDQLEEARA